MDDFRSLLKVSEEFDYNKIGMNIDKYRIFSAIKAGKYELSIQASYSHYCNPRKTLDNLNDYLSMEIAIFKNNAWVQPREDKIIQKFSRYEESDFKDVEWFREWNIERNDPILIQVVKELGEKASGRFGELKVVEIPDDIQWEITDYDGIETIEEVHRSWS